ncbi:hypothetical protein DFH05DRAFT_1461187 [Lentinula detonsa]|uniref:Uncharacterized protein n=1 Tax=Lentinula detonsa TaxID=2804962 RepID=A0A9W8NXV0_9AGAR|nr:hypothetical protein DFH05DRAFT_1461187 [Lentinula detonsa]
MSDTPTQSSTPTAPNTTQWSNHGHSSEGEPDAASIASITHSDLNIIKTTLWNFDQFTQKTEKNFTEINNNFKDLDSLLTSTFTDLRNDIAKILPPAPSAPAPAPSATVPTTQHPAQAPVIGGKTPNFNPPKTFKGKSTDVDTFVDAVSNAKLENLTQNGSAAAYASRYHELLVHVDWSEQSKINNFYSNLKTATKDMISITKREDRPNRFDDYVGDGKKSGKIW